MLEDCKGRPAEQQLQDCKPAQKSREPQSKHKQLTKQKTKQNIDIIADYLIDIGMVI